MASLLTRVLGSNKERSISRGSLACIAAVLATSSCSRGRDDKRIDAAAVLAASSRTSQASAGAASSSDIESTGRAGRASDADLGAVGTSPAPGAAVASAAATPFPVDAGRLGLKFEKPFDLGPAGAIVATPTGALLRTRGDEILDFVFSGGGTPSKRIGRSEDEGGGVEGRAASSQPPAFTRGAFAYWVTRGNLVRRAVRANPAAAAPLEILAEGALDGSRVAAEAAPVTGTGTGKRREVAIYIARAEKKGDDRAARIWVEGAGSAALSSDGSGASSVALAPGASGLVAVMLDARSAMSPVHARTIEVGESGPARLGADVVVFIGPSPEGHSEVAAAASPEGPLAFIPFAPDTSSFGLSSLMVGNEPHLDAQVQWRMYPNGLEPAPVAAAFLCGRTWVAYARPSASAPASPHVLALAPVERGAFGPELSASQGFDFMAVSLSSREDGGAWLSWVSDGRSFLRAVRCP